MTTGEVASLTGRPAEVLMFMSDSALQEFRESLRTHRDGGRHAHRRPDRVAAPGPLPHLQDVFSRNTELLGPGSSGRHREKPLVGICRGKRPGLPVADAPRVQ